MPEYVDLFQTGERVYIPSAMYSRFGVVAEPTQTTTVFGRDLHTTQVLFNRATEPETIMNIDLARIPAQEASNV